MIRCSGIWINNLVYLKRLEKNANISRRSSHKNHIKGPKKRTEEDDERFAQSFEKMILMAKSKEELRNTDR
ncbi:hypothetical protein DW975_16050 [Agathobacter rectalis]|uniref:Uncharacterized protein n=1 Tax=Agathobacter rectalis TaxID=39491 RepID=A0A413PC09_9FIRM|nr:hypothetical protein DW975_16050 [Agathobacter rectalis]